MCQVAQSSIGALRSMSGAYPLPGMTHKRSRSKRGCGLQKITTRHMIHKRSIIRACLRSQGQSSHEINHAARPMGSGDPGNSKMDQHNLCQDTLKVLWGSFLYFYILSQSNNHLVRVIRSTADHENSKILIFGFGL